MWLSGQPISTSAEFKKHPRRNYKHEYWHLAPPPGDQLLDSDGMHSSYESFKISLGDSYTHQNLWNTKNLNPGPQVASTAFPRKHGEQLRMN